MSSTGPHGYLDGSPGGGNHRHVAVGRDSARLRCRSSEELLPEPGMATGRRFRPRRRHPSGPADAPSLGVLDRIREGPHHSRARLRSAFGAGRPDIDAAREDLVGRVEVSDVFHRDGRCLLPGPDPEHRSYLSHASFSDPDGNSWLLQEVTTRLSGQDVGRVRIDVAAFATL
jgi:hypothetical protein